MHIFNASLTHLSSFSFSPLVFLVHLVGREQQTRREKERKEKKEGEVKSVVATEFFDIPPIFCLFFFQVAPA